MRKWAIHNLAAILKQHKRKHPKTEVDLREQAVAVSQEETPFCGPRPDNHWICYDSDQRPGNVTFLIKEPCNQSFNAMHDFLDTEESWNSRHFFHKPHLGFYAWPVGGKIQVYDRSKSPKLDRDPDSEMTEGERAIHQVWSIKHFDVLFFLVKEIIDLPGR